VFVILIQAEGVIDIFYDVLGKKIGHMIWFSSLIDTDPLTIF